MRFKLGDASKSAHRPTQEWEESKITILEINNNYYASADYSLPNFTDKIFPLKLKIKQQYKCRDKREAAAATVAKCIVNCSESLKKIYI